MATFATRFTKAGVMGFCCVSSPASRQFLFSGDYSSAVVSDTLFGNCTSSAWELSAVLKKAGAMMMIHQNVPYQPDLDKLHKNPGVKGGNSSLVENGEEVSVALYVHPINSYLYFLQCRSGQKMYLKVLVIKTRMWLEILHRSSRTPSTSYLNKKEAI